MIKSNIDSISVEKGYDVVIICCSSEEQAGYWQQRLENGRGSLLAPSALVLAVSEDWEGGAGNALGTLYAFQKASSLAKSRDAIDLEEVMSRGKSSIAMYHTAGKGTRLAPLPGAENNNKPGVKLPIALAVGAEMVPMTILEAVIKQTSSYAASRPGRLSVYWGDQVFIPTVPVEYSVSHHVDILCSLGPMPSEEEWLDKGMNKYGLIAQSESGEAAQVEKVSYQTANEMLAGLGSISSVGVSLGSFSVSNSMLFALLSEFCQELNEKRGKLDSDPHLWMPMTLPKDAYMQLMKAKGMEEEHSGAHYDRMGAFVGRFKENLKGEGATLGLFGPVDVGQGVYWWDYGQLRLYQRNAMLLSAETSESALMRRFFGMSEDTSSRIVNTDTSRIVVDSSSCVSNCNLGIAEEGNISCGSIKGSVLCNVNCKYIDAENCILINVTAERIIARSGSIVYNVVDESGKSGLDLDEGQVLTGVFSNDGSQLLMNSSLSIDGGNAWKEVLAENRNSFEDVYKSNTNANPLTLEGVIRDKHNAIWSNILCEHSSGVAKTKAVSESQGHEDSSGKQVELEGAERILDVDGNMTCVDCGVGNADWASINLGIIMCVKCSGVHRSLGVHISQVRSLTLDTTCWRGDLLSFMCSVGNSAFNATWESSIPKGVVRPQSDPTNAEIRNYFIRRKYEKKSFMTPKHIDSGDDVVKSQVVSKLGGKDKSLFHKWQPRTLTLTADGKLYYSKDGKDTNDALGIIDLTSPNHPPPDFEYGSKKSSKGFTFKVPTCKESEHVGRTFLFACETMIDCIEWVEVISSAIPHFAPAFSVAWKQDRQYSLLEEESAQLAQRYKSNIISHVFMQGELMQKVAGSWLVRHCTLSEDAFYISDDEQGFSVIAIPIKVLYVHRKITCEDGDPNKMFALWHPLSYNIMSAMDNNEKNKWIEAIEERVKK